MASRCASRDDRWSVSDSSRVWGSAAAVLFGAAGGGSGADDDAPRPLPELGLFLRRLAPLLLPAFPASAAADDNEADPTDDGRLLPLPALPPPPVDDLCLRAAVRLRLRPAVGCFPMRMPSWWPLLLLFWLAEFDDMPPPNERERLLPPPPEVVLGIAMLK